LQLGSSVRNIVNMATIAVIDAQLKSEGSNEQVTKSPWWKRFKRNKEVPQNGQ
jgi:malate dehydrogenase (oxaloacetate-decarboxylating)(NADP+)